MHSNDYESLILSGGDITIRQYASYVLSNPQVKEAINKFYTYRETADRMIDSLQGMIDTGETPFPLANEGEKEAFCDMAKDMEHLKKLAFVRIISTLSSIYSEEYCTIKMARKRGMCQLQPLRTEAINAYSKEMTIELLEKRCHELFFEFAVTQPFSDYLFTGKIPYIQRGSTFFNAQEELIGVFCLFLWLMRIEKTSLGSHIAPTLFENKHCFDLLQNFNEHIKLDHSGEIQLLFDHTSWGLIRVDNAYYTAVDIDTLDCLVERFYPQPIYSKACSQCLGQCVKKPYLVRDEGKTIFCTASCMKLYDNKRKT